MTNTQALDTSAQYRTLARRMHNEKVGYHPNSAKYAELQKLVSEYSNRADELESEGR
jgi:cytidylate kinase